VDEGSIIKLWVSKGIESAPIPYVIGESDGNAERILFDAGFIAVFASSKEYSDSVPKDHVIRQTPNASTIATKGSTVTLVISDGPSQVAVPVNLIGMNRDDATNTLASVGLFVKVETIETTSSDDVDKVLSCEPGVGTMVAKGSTITIYIGKQIVEPPPPIIPPGPGGNGP
jgi:serine/threonine-protein kinase